uniref:Calcitonin peptide-like domain-containing protein n=1 Tax=Sinocyclocheilus grahami TaxID=75366 RepID=A0A672QS78_SINGR
MNIMILVWTLSSLILSYAFGFPFLNSTSHGSYMFPNVTERNITWYNNNTNQTSHQFQLERFPTGGKPGCSLATCATQNLVDRIQTGDEKAGKSASDPWGPGKK